MKNHKSANFKFYSVFVQHNNGIVKLKVKAMNKAIAEHMVVMFENCPPSAILKTVAL